MEIGRKIYYELSTGNVIFDSGERQGVVIETTEDQDFQMYAALQPYQQNAVGVLQLSFGEDAANFGKYPFHVDTSTSPPSIAWDTANSIGASLADVQASKISQLRDMFTQTLCAGFTSNADGTSRTYGYTPTDHPHSDQANMNKIATQVSLGTATYPIQYADISGNPVDLTQTQFSQLLTDASKFEWAQTDQLRTLIGKVQAIDPANYSTSQDAIDTVNAIQWSEASY